MVYIKQKITNGELFFRVGKKIKSFGTFSDLDEARLVRDEALKKEGLR